MPDRNGVNNRRISHRRGSTVCILPILPYLYCSIYTTCLYCSIYTVLSIPPVYTVHREGVTVRTLGA